MNKKNLNIIGLSALSIILLGFDCFYAANYSSLRDNPFKSDKFKEAASESDELVQNIEGEGIVLLKNNHDALPLQKNKNGKIPINLFGWASNDNANILRGIGSGSSTIDSKNKVGLNQALEDEGFLINEELQEFYKNFDNTDYNTRGMKARTTLKEPSIFSYSSEMIDRAYNFSTTAILVIGRVIGEDQGEVPNYQSKINSVSSTVDYSRSYLDLTKEEENLLNKVENTFDKTIVVINSSNQMNLSFLDDDLIDAALSIGLPGQSGLRSLAKILKGDINPSGKLTDTYAYDFKTNPSYVNALAMNNNQGLKQVVYEEGIYVGYRWYETAYSDGYFKDKEYDQIVQYPFGYGLSYTNFTWEITSINISPNSSFDNNTNFDIEFKVVNNGSVPGKDVIQVYCTKPYYEGGIEKSYVDLVGFTKTTTINPGEAQTGIHIQFSAYDLTSFDCYDSNNNGYSSYELDSGKYQIKIMTDSHNLKQMKGKYSSILNFEMPDTYVYKNDPKTKYEIKSRFTGNNCYANLPLDGTTVNKNIKYLTRSDFNNSFPKQVNDQILDSIAISTSDYTYYNHLKNIYTEIPTNSINSNLYLVTDINGNKLTLDELNSNSTQYKFNWDLIHEIASHKSSKALDDLVSQMSLEEMKKIVELSGFETKAIESIGKPKFNEYDGPAGLNKVVFSSIPGKWTIFPNETVIGQTFNTNLAYQLGLSIAKEGNESGIRGWYAPGANIHRTPFTGRNYEYYSEDPLLSGEMAGETASGAKANGMYVYMKHLVLCEQGDNSTNVYTFATEQALREIYLKPFEKAVKNYGLMGVMSSFNNVGAIWSGANYALMTEILRNEWGFDGVVITDYTKGTSPMSPTAGVVSGNDLWLCPFGKSLNPLPIDDPVYMNCAKNSVKNYIYAICNTFDYYKNYNHDNDSITVNIEKNIARDEASPAWMISVIIVNTIGIIGIIIWFYFGYFRKEK